MTPPSRIAAVLAAAGAGAALAFPAAAGARAGDRTFQQTFPVASTVCAKVAAGTEGKHLKRFATQVTADCTALQSTFSTAQSTVLAARSAISAQIAADRALTGAACPASAKAPTVACRHTRAVNDLAIDRLHRQMHHAVRRYYRTIEAARERFWNAIHALPGERRAHQDLPIAQLPS
jgi:hypothetical protein